MIHLSPENSQTLGTLDWNLAEETQIHLTRYIQPHGILLVLAEPDLTIAQASENLSLFWNLPVEAILGKPLSVLLPASQFTKLKNSLEDFVENCHNHSAKTLKLILEKENDSVVVDAIFHRNSAGLLILELEPNPTSQTVDFLDFYQSVRGSTFKLKEADSWQQMCQTLVRELRRITQFDRVMIYKFHEDWSGQVVAEDKRPDFSPLLNLHFPAQDTQPALALFQANWLRVIVDIETPQAAIVPSLNPQTDRPVDLTFSTLRGVSPCHQAYLRHMGVRSTLVMSLILNGRLWGLIACHHSSPKLVSYEMRQTCELLGQVMSLELALTQENQDYEYCMNLKNIHTKLVEYMANSSHFVEGLTQYSPNLLNLVSATGAVVVWDGEITTLGQVPPESALLELLNWLSENAQENLFVTDHLAHSYPAAAAFKDQGSGILVTVMASQNLIVWFRPEQIHSVDWAGNPYQAVQSQIDQTGQLKLSPRSSFEAWKETVQLKSQPWKPCEIEVAQDLRNSLIHIVLHQAEELKKLMRELERSNIELEKFAYIASHDLQEPLNLVASYVQLLERRYKPQLGKDGQEFIDFAVESVHHMQTLIDDLLAYSRVGSQGRAFQLINTAIVLNRVLRTLEGRITNNQASLTHDPLPTLMADEMQLTQLFQNLLVNALKFRRQEPPQIHIRVEQHPNHWLFSVADNGIGIEPEFFDRIFLIFQRLHTREEYPGTGVGLAICKKIVERHGGEIWVESTLGQGSTFFFTIPV